MLHYSTLGIYSTFKKDSKVLFLKWSHKRAFTKFTQNKWLFLLVLMNVTCLIKIALCFYFSFLLCSTVFIYRFLLRIDIENS